MYSAVIRKITRRNLERVNNHDYASFLAACSPDIHHRFGGEHALGGERHDRDALGQWFERLGRLFPTLRLDAHDIWVKGGPSNTTVIVRWTSAATLVDGSAYHNHGVHIVTMRWGKAIAIDATEDSQAVAAALGRIAATGNLEATAEPIRS